MATPKANSKTRIAIIGTGGIAGAHVTSYLRMADVEVIGGADIVEGKARKFFDAFNLKAAKDFNSAAAMLDALKPDAVSVCTYNSSHADVPSRLLSAAVMYSLKSP